MISQHPGSLAAECKLSVHSIWMQQTYRRDSATRDSGGIDSCHILAQLNGGTITRHHVASGVGLDSHRAHQLRPTAVTDPTSNELLKAALPERGHVAAGWHRRGKAGWAAPATRSWIFGRHSSTFGREQLIQQTAARVIHRVTGSSGAAAMRTFAPCPDYQGAAAGLDEKTEGIIDCARSDLNRRFELYPALRFAEAGVSIWQGTRMIIRAKAPVDARPTRRRRFSGRRFLGWQRGPAHVNICRPDHKWIPGRRC